MEILFKPMYSSMKVSSEIYLLKRFEWRDIFTKLREKNHVIHINIVYKQKADKIKPINLGKTTRKVPGELSNWWDILWAQWMAKPELIKSNPPHQYDAYIMSRFSQFPQDWRLTPEWKKTLKISLNLTPNKQEFLLKILMQQEECVRG